MEWSFIRGGDNSSTSIRCGINQGTPLLKYILLVDSSHFPSTSQQGPKIRLQGVYEVELDDTFSSRDMHRHLATGLSLSRARSLIVAVLSLSGARAFVGPTFPSSKTGSCRNPAQRCHIGRRCRNAIAGALRSECTRFVHRTLSMSQNVEDTKTDGVGDGAAERAAQLRALAADLRAQVIDLPRATTAVAQQTRCCCTEHVDIVELGRIFKDTNWSFWVVGT